MDWVDKFQNVLTEMHETGHEFAQAKALSWQMQELSSALKSKLMLDAMQLDPKLSAQKAEAVARASDAYSKHLEGTAQAIAKELRLKCKYETSFARYESYRSLLSLDKKTGGLQ